jgi:hypothetical protein
MRPWLGPRGVAGGPQEDGVAAMRSTRPSRLREPVPNVDSQASKGPRSQPSRTRASA